MATRFPGPSQCQSIRQHRRIRKRKYRSGGKVAAAAHPRLLGASARARLRGHRRRSRDARRRPGSGLATDGEPTGRVACTCCETRGDGRGGGGARAGGSPASRSAGRGGDGPRLRRRGRPCAPCRSRAGDGGDSGSGLAKHPHQRAGSTRVNGLDPSPPGARRHRASRPGRGASAPRPSRSIARDARRACDEPRRALLPSPPAGRAGSRAAQPLAAPALQLLVMSALDPAATLLPVRNRPDGVRR